MGLGACTSIFQGDILLAVNSNAAGTSFLLFLIGEHRRQI